MNELSLKLKNEVIRKLTSNEQNLDENYLVRGEKLYTRRQLANEIEVETEFGISLLSSMIILAIDISTRQKQ